MYLCQFGALSCLTKEDNLRLSIDIIKHILNSDGSTIELTEESKNQVYTYFGSMYAMSRPTVIYFRILIIHFFVIHLRCMFLVLSFLVNNIFDFTYHQVSVFHNEQSCKSINPTYLGEGSK